MQKAMMLYAKDRRCYLEWAYTESVREQIKTFCDLLPDPVNEMQLEEYAEILKEIEILFTSWWVPELTVLQIKKYFPKLKIVFYAAGSVQYFARSFLENGVRVVSGWAANGTPVAEYTVAQIILANKGFFQNSIRMRENYDDARAFSDCFSGNYGAKIGILGAGAVGSRVISLLRPYQLEVWVYDPYLSEKRAEELNVTKHSLEEIFEQCDVISNHVAKLPETEGMINYSLLSRMKSCSTLLNTGRGSQIVEDDLIRVMQEDCTRTAVLDVTDPEPPIEDSLLYGTANIILTTHIAGSMGLEIGRIGQYIADEALRFVRGEPLKYEITEETLQTMA